MIDRIEHIPEIYFGDPSRPRYLRDLLANRINDVPPGGNINWVTYYFRDRKLAEALIQARARGVNVTVCMADKPRTSDANNAIIDMFSQPSGLGSGLRTVSLPGIPAPPGRAWKLQVHEKIYCFSHPKPIAFIGSFNPSGDNPEERPDIIREIGDQDRGYNFLAGITEPALVEPLIKHAREMHQSGPRIFDRFTPDARLKLEGKDTTIYFFPRLGANPMLQFLSQFGRGTRIRIATSHIRSNHAVKFLAALAKKGINIEILAERTLRRVTYEAEQQLRSAGIYFRRIEEPSDTPMHLKFVLIESNNRIWSIFGSLNWTNPSFWLNHEILAISSNPVLSNAFSQCWSRLDNI